MLLLLLLCSATSWAAGNTTILSAGTDQFDLSKNASVLHDPEGKLSVDQALAAADWKALEGASPVFGFADGAFWFRTTVQQNNHPEQRWVYLLPYALLDHIELTILRADGSREVRSSGDRLPFSSRDLKHRHFNFLIDLRGGESVELLLRVQTESSVQAPQWLITREVFFARTHEAQAGMGVYYGILLALLLFNLIIYLSLREPAYGWYVLYVATFGLVQLNLNGLAFEYLWPDSPNWANLALPLTMALGQTSMALFAPSFLDLKRHRPALARLFQVFVGWQLAMLLLIPLIGYRPSILIETAAVFLITLMILIAAIYCILDGFRPARFFLLAWSALLLGTVSYALVSFGLLPKVFLTEYGIQIGSALEMTLLSFALAFRIRDLEIDKQSLISRSRDELEAQVQQRTKDLNKALTDLSAVNRRLHEYSLRDGLTGAYNRRFLEQRLDAMWESSASRVESLAVLMIDLDHFKAINDEYGHLIGDDCLRAVADLLHGHVRGNKEFLARWGGEEFILLIAGLSPSEVKARAEQIRSAMESQLPPIQGKQIPLRLSIGVACMQASATAQVEVLIDAADRALYRAKRAGRNRVELA